MLLFSSYTHTQSIQKMRSRLLFSNWGILSVIGFWLCIIFANVFCQNELPNKLKLSKTDFAQCYMAGLSVATGLTDCLYPESQGDVLFLSGTVKEPLHTRLLDRNWNRSTVYIYPPPFALLLTPFGFLSYPVAFFFFSIINFLAIFIVLLLLQKHLYIFFRKEKPERFISPLIFLMGCGLPMVHAVSASNISPLIMLAIALVVDGILKNQTAAIVFGYIFAAITKGYSVFWVPLLLIVKKWKIVLWGGVFSILLLIASIVVLGLENHLDFFSRIIPESICLYWIGDGNIGLPSLFAFLSGKSDGVPIPVPLSLSIVQYGFLLMTYFLVFRKKHFSVSAWILGLFLSLLIVLLFAPISWTHYILLLLPFFPTCLKLNTGRKLLSLYCIGWSLVWFPIGNMIKYLCKLPILGYGRTLGYICLLIWGVFTLWNLSEDILQKELSNLDSRHA